MSHWPASMLWHVIAITQRERRHVTYGDAGRTTTVRIRAHYAVAADDGGIAAQMIRALPNIIAIVRVDAAQTGIIRMRERNYP